MSAPNPGGAPSPDGGWSNEIETLASATIVPPSESATVQACGVLKGDGSFCQHSATWRGHKQMMTVPEYPVGEIKTLPGQHLYAGQLWAHFGHFIAESTSRLWALDHLKQAVDSIIFIPKRPGRTMEIKRYQKEFFELLGIDIPIQIIGQPTIVKDLVVPGQGFGLGDIARGTPEFRAYFKANFAQNVAAAPTSDLYLSRSGLGGLEGTIVLEEHLEQNLIDQGYEVFHPQRHSLSEQIARYKGAKNIVGPDGSAFHLFAFIGKPEQKVSIILRRNSNVFNGLRDHIESFSGITSHVMDLVQADWIPSHKKRPGRYSFGQLDFDALGQGLSDAGFITDLDKWKTPKFRLTVAAMEQFSKEKGIEFIRVKKSAKAQAKA